MVTSKLEIQKTAGFIGGVYGGEVELTIDTKNKFIFTKGFIKVGPVIRKKDYPLNSHKALQSSEFAALRSAAVTVNSVYNFSNFKIAVNRLEGKTAVCAVTLTTLDDNAMTGVALIDLSEEFITVTHIDASGSFYKYPVRLLATKKV